MLIALTSTKGGVGKSTIAVHIAQLFANESAKTILVDTDRQGSAASWIVWRTQEHKLSAPELTRLFDREIITQARALRERYDRVIIDTRGADSVSLRAALIVSDIAIVPVRDSDFDGASLDDMRALIDEVRTVNDRLRVVSFLSQIDERRKFPTRIRDYLDEIGFNPLKTVIHFRSAFSKAAHGLTVLELKDAKAKSEMLSLFMEIKDIMDLKGDENV